MRLAFSASLLAIAAASPALAQDALFAGCDNPEAVAPEGIPSERIEARREPVVDRITERTFASLSADEVERGAGDEFDALCWARLDGVWRAIGEVQLDRSQDDPDAWGADRTELLALTNGNYTSQSYLVIEPGRDENELLVATGLTDSGFVSFVSDDGVPLQEVMQRGGALKSYSARGPFEHGERLVVDMTRSGRLRIEMADLQFLRPALGVSRASMSRQVAADDAFLIDRNLDNLAASRRGYDPASQDPFYLLQNDKAEIFARVDPRNYVLYEKRTVPLGFTLIQENSSGTIFHKSLVTSENEISIATGHSFGIEANAQFKAKGIPVDVSRSFDYARESIRTMRNSNSVAKAMGYSRAKQYALVVDHPYVTLSDDFIDAVEDARRYHRYQELIDRFGTHYAYAVTYGAAAQVTQSFDSDSYAQGQADNENFKLAGGLKVGAGLKGYYGQINNVSSGSSGTIGEEGATFVSVGGNGSWNELGYAPGPTSYPILLDLRPISELLNPMNFPGEPEITTRVRDNLRRAIAIHLIDVGGPLSAESLAAGILPTEPEPIEQWRVTLNRASCSGNRAQAATTKRAVGTIGGNIDLGDGRRDAGQRTGFNVLCKYKPEVERYSGTIATISGTRAEIVDASLNVGVEIDYNPGNKRIDDTRDHAAPFARGLPPGGKKDVTWVFGMRHKPDVKLVVTFERLN